MMVVEKEKQTVKSMQTEDEIEMLVQTLDQETISGGVQLCLYEGFWYWVRTFAGILRTQTQFTAHDTDIILATMPKCGTTWLKALTFTIVNRHIYSIDEKNPLFTSNPHELIPYLEINLNLNQQTPILESKQIIFGTHMPYNSLPDSIFQSKCRIIYICRNPLDQFISDMHFMVKNMAVTGVEYFDIVDSFDKFCRGIHFYGPFLEHVLGYWNAHKKGHQNILFLKYEDLKKDIFSNVKIIAEFVGLPFSSEEEEQGLVEKIADMCSFEHLKNLEVNKTGGSSTIRYSDFFRKGEVGDWANYLSTDMVERLETIVEQKLRGSGLSFDFSI